jgi:hypothetical protein
MPSSGVTWNFWLASTSEVIFRLMEMPKYIEFFIIIFFL